MIILNIVIHTFNLRHHIMSDITLVYVFHHGINEV